MFGSGPLCAIEFVAKLDLTADPDPNPIGFGVLAGVTIRLIVWGLATR